MSNSTFQHALSTLLTELFDGPPADAAYILNQKDPGMIRQLQSTSAAVASARPMPGQTTIAAHVNHVLYGLTLLNRWSHGDPNPWATADWALAWKTTRVADTQWQQLLTQFAAAAHDWQSHLTARTDFNDLAALGAISSLAHTAYHLGAIRQLLAAQNQNHAPR